MGKHVMKGGMMTVEAASMTLYGTKIATATAAASASGANASIMLSAGGIAAVPTVFGLIASGVIFSAQTGLDYRRYKKG